jgi:hypothetical protein
VGLIPAAPLPHDSPKVNHLDSLGNAQFLVSFMWYADDNHLGLPAEFFL